MYDGGSYCYPSGIPDNVRHADPNTVIKVACSIVDEDNQLSLFQWQLPPKGYIDIRRGRPKIKTVNGFTSTVIYSNLKLINVTLEFKAKSSFDNLLISCGNGGDTKDHCQLKIKSTY